MVELRKRKEPEAPVPPPLAKRNSGSGSKIKKLADKAKASVIGGDAKPAESSPLAATTNGSSKAERLSDGYEIEDLEAFGGQLETHDGSKVSVKELLEKSGAGIVLFTYPKASTPGCTTQACLFRDSYSPITGASLNVYGLSTDSPKSNTTFATKQNLPYQLLCDPKATLIKAIGMHKGGAGSGTSRGVVVIDKQGVCKVWFQGGPQKTLDAVLEYVGHGGAMTEATGGSTAVAAPVAIDDPHASEEAAKLAEPDHFPGHTDGTTPGVGTADSKMLEAPLIKEASRSEEHIADTAAEVNESAKMVDA